MKKIHTPLLPTVFTIIVFLGITSVSASMPTFVSSVTGSAPTTTSVEMGDRASMYRYNQDNNTKEESLDENEYETMVATNNEKNKADFKMYAYGEGGNVSTITSVTTRDDRVSMTRTIPVKVFWLFPSTMSETATVISFGNDQNQVTVTRPWWRFFSKGEFSEEDIAGYIEARIKNIPSSQFVVLLSTSTKATLLLKIRESFLLTSSSTIISK